MSIKRSQPKDHFEYKLDEVHYPYHHPNSEKVAREHAKMNVIVPDTSKQTPFYLTNHNDLKFILRRKELHAHKYQFSMYDSELDALVSHSVLWDYETGHVRISPMFKSAESEYLRRKNTPRRWVERNGLQDCYASTTGGKIEAQGFWLPFTAAKALCSKFCYPIRYALTPLFGNDFPSLCKSSKLELLDMGYQYGSEASLDIDQTVVRAVRARQAIIEWQILFKDGDRRVDRKSPLPSLDEAWRDFVMAHGASSIPPKLQHPREQQLPSVSSIQPWPSRGTVSKRAHLPQPNSVSSISYTHFDVPDVANRRDPSFIGLPSFSALLLHDGEHESYSEFSHAPQDCAVSKYASPSPKRLPNHWDHPQSPKPSSGPENDLQAAYALMQLKYGMGSGGKSNAL